MIDGSLYLSFLLAAIVLVVTPGPDMMFILAVGARDGSGAGFAAALRVAVGLSVHTAAAVLGLSALLTALPPLYDALRWLGVVYLTYLAINAFRARRDLDQQTPRVTRETKVHAFRRAVLTNLLNPKVILFNAAFLPQFVDPERGGVALQFLLLGLSLVVIDLAIDGPIGLAAGRLSRRLRASRALSRSLDILSGTVFAGLAARLALARD